LDIDENYFQNEEEKQEEIKNTDSIVLKVAGYTAGIVFGFLAGAYMVSSNLFGRKKVVLSKSQKRRR